MKILTPGFNPVTNTDHLGEELNQRMEDSFDIFLTLPPSLLPSQLPSLCLFFSVYNYDF